MPVELYHQRVHWCSKLMITEDVLSIKVCHLIDLWPHSSDLIWGIVCLPLLKILLSMWKQSGAPGGVKTKNKPEGHECIPLQGPVSRHCFLENARKWAHLKCWNVWVYTKVERSGGPLLLSAVMVTNCANNLLVLHCKCKFLKMSCNFKWEGFFFLISPFLILISFLRQCPETTPSSVEVNVKLIYVLRWQTTNQSTDQPTHIPTNPSTE